MRFLGRSGPDEPGPEAIITGRAWVRSLARPLAPARLVVEEVTFAPASHTAWHSHPFGQLVIVTAGNGWLQSRGRPAIPVSVGDAVWIEPGEEHWHGSTPDTLLAHLNIQEHDDGADARITRPLGGAGYPPVTVLTPENEGFTA